MKCPVCRTDNPPDSKFCKECATPLPTSRLSPPLVTETLETVREELTTGTLFAGRYQIIEPAFPVLVGTADIGNSGSEIVVAGRYAYVIYTVFSPIYRY